MFGLGGGELVVVIILAILLIGPRDIPKAANQIGRWVRQFKFAANDFKETLQKEIEIDEDHPSDPKKS